MKQKTRKHCRRCPTCGQFIEIYGRHYLLFKLHQAKHDGLYSVCPKSDGNAGLLKIGERKPWQNVRSVN